MYKVQRRLFSQNFLHNRKLVRSLVEKSLIGKNDLVLEIGPGKGIITQELIQRAAHVFAVEIDTHWFTYLQQTFPAQENLTLFHQDFLSFELPRHPYKVFANVPFAIEGKIIRKLLEAHYPPISCWLVVMREVAERWSGKKNANLFSVTHQPWFEFSIDHYFHPADFVPRPNVAAVLLHFHQRKQPLLSWRERRSYQRFVELAFHNGQPIRNNLKKSFSVHRVDQTMQELSIRKQATPTHLSLQQWIKLYQRLHRQ